MDFHPTYYNDHKYIIVTIDYFNKWVEAMPTFNNTSATTTIFLCNHGITSFSLPKQLVSNDENHFHNDIFKELSFLMGFTNYTYETFWSLLQE